MKERKVSNVSNTQQLGHGLLYFLTFAMVWGLCLGLVSMSLRALTHLGGFELGSRGVSQILAIVISALLAAFLLRAYWKPQPLQSQNENPA